MEKSCSVCRKPFSTARSRVHTCSKACGRERNRIAARKRAERLKKEAIPRPAWIPNPDEKDLEPLTRDQKEAMWDSVMRIFFPLDAQVADAFLQSSNLGCRGHGISIVSL